MIRDDAAAAARAAPERVAEDVRQGYVSAVAARRLYGVILDPTGSSVDLAATTAERERLRGLGLPSDELVQPAA